MAMPDGCWQMSEAVKRHGPSHKAGTCRHSTRAGVTVHLCLLWSLLLLELQVSNVSSSCRAALAASSQTLADKTAGLQTQLDGTLRHFDNIMEGTAELQVEVTDEVSKWMCGAGGGGYSKGNGGCTARGTSDCSAGWHPEAF